MAEPAEPETLWDFACRVYAQEGVAATCLTLQDEHGLDVDVVLGVLWLAAQGQRLDAPGLDAMLAAAEPVRAPIGRIRALRRAVGERARAEPEWRATYEQLRNAELAAERIELERIEAALLAARSAARADAPRAATPAHDGPQLAREGLRRYAAACGAPDDEAARRRLVQLTFAPGTRYGPGRIMDRSRW